MVVDADQTQLYGGAPVNRFISGDFTLDDSTAYPALNQRKLVARRALFEMRKGAVGNNGRRRADGIVVWSLAGKAAPMTSVMLTVETGGGRITSQGVAFGANVNTRAISI